MRKPKPFVRRSIESRVQEYATAHCAENTGHCKGCQHRQSARFFGDPSGDDWCYLAEGNLRKSRVEMCPAFHTSHTQGQARREKE